MGMTVKKAADTSTSTRFVSNKGKIADLPMGVSISVTRLVAGQVLLDGTPIASPSSGVFEACKFAKCLTGTTTTSVKVATVGNQFKVGDIVCSKLNGKAYAITVIASSNGVDTMTIGTAIDAPLSNGGFIYEAAAEAAGPVDATFNIAYDNDTCSGLTADATSDALTVAPGKLGEVATIVGTIGAAGAGNAKVTVTSALLAAAEEISVAVANNDTNLIVATKIRAALMANAAIAAKFIVGGFNDKVTLTTIDEYTATGSTLKYPAPYAITGTNVLVDAASNLTVDAWVIAAVKAGTIGPLLLDALRLNYRYISELY